VNVIIARAIYVNMENTSTARELQNNREKKKAGDPIVRLGFHEVILRSGRAIRKRDTSYRHSKRRTYCEIPRSIFINDAAQG